MELLFLNKWKREYKNIDRLSLENSNQVLLISFFI